MTDELKEELRELVDQWRSNLDGLEDIGTPQALGAKRERERCAGELEDLLDERGDA